MTTRPNFYRFHNGEQAILPFENEEYSSRLAQLRERLESQGASAAVFTSMHNVAYYSGFLYCAFGRPYGLVVTEDACVTISAGIDGGQPWRRCFSDNLTYTDWERDNFWRAVREVVGEKMVVGVESDHLTLLQQAKVEDFLKPIATVDICQTAMRQRMYKSDAEVALIRHGSQVADIGGYAVHDAIRNGVREIDVAMAGRDAMELEIAKRFPEAEYRDTWVWFQSGINTDGAHNPVTSRILRRGDILSLNTFPMISGYYTALERTLFLETVDAVSLAVWEANIGAHELGISMLKPGISCSAVTEAVNEFFKERDLLKYRSFGYGHSFGVLSHYYGREAGLEIREDIHTILEPGMVISMEPMLTLPEGLPGAGGYREHDILVITEGGAENLTSFPYGPSHNAIF